jgi:hypothetical protein
MTEPRRATSPANAARIAVAGVIIAGGALAMSGHAGADPAVPYPTPVPSDPGAPTPVPGQPVVESTDGPAGEAAPPPVFAPSVPEIQNPVYGAGQTPGQLGYLRDIWHTFHSGNPLDALTAPAEQAPGPPPGAGPPPQLPPGYVSLTSPRPATPMPGAEPGAVAAAEPEPPHPPLPPGYVSLNAPRPATGPVPGEESAPPPDPAAPPTIVPVPPTP